MNQKIFINNLGPIKNCVLEINNFTILTGTQASGKSTIAKAIFFCRTVKDEIYDVIIKRSLINKKTSLLDDVRKVLRNKFLQIFGTSRAMSPEMKIKYVYSQNAYIDIWLTDLINEDFISPNYVHLKFGQAINDFLNQRNESLVSIGNSKTELIKSLNVLFDDSSTTLFIPAGRSLITLLTNQLNYIFTMMDDEQKWSIDYSTQKYVETILKIRPLFENGIIGMLNNKSIVDGNINSRLIGMGRKIMDGVLQGKYVYVNGEERLLLSNERYVKLNYTSSGQQESVWIFNIMMYILSNATKYFVIIEEPEAHLYPDAQKKITELLGLVAYAGHQIMVTTHSPYILGEINNLVYASKKNKINSQATDKIVPKEMQIAGINSYFLHDAILENCIAEDGLIKNEVIDGASEEINTEYFELDKI